MAREFVAPWGDWKTIDFLACYWLFNGAQGQSLDPFSPLPFSRCGLDIIDTYLTSSAPDASVIGGTISKPSFLGADLGGQGAASAFNGFQTQIGIPDYIFEKQPGNLVDWTGAMGDDMGEGSRRLFIEFENILVGNPNAPGLGGQLPATIAGFHGSVKYRGFGDPVDTFQTEDTPICSAALVAGATFDAMSLPPPATTDFPSFADGSGVTLRLRTLVLIPNTVGVGDWLEATFLFQPGTGFANVPATSALPVIQWYGSKYRFMKGPIDPAYVVGENETVQLTVDSGADGTDESQPRVDEGPYEP